jgi:radical SAM protein with 4Fe4S-binding SPASM domain
VYQNPLINIEAAARDDDVDEEVEEPNIEAGGTVAPQCVDDKGENIPRIVEQLRDEDREFDEAMNADSSDGDEDVPEEWVSSNFSHLVIDEGSSVPWDCRENEIVQSARYPLMREFKTVECKSCKYDVICVKEGCPWRVHAYKGKWKNYWKCSIVTQHTQLFNY